MKDIAAILDSKEILLDLDVADSRALFAAVGDALQSRHGLDALRIAAALEAREALGSTGIGMGVAIPHARIEESIEKAQAAHAAFVRLRTPIDFGAPDGDKVGLFFILLAPASATERHLDILASFAALMMNARLRESLLKIDNGQEIRDLLAKQIQPEMRKAA